MKRLLLTIIILALVLGITACSGEAPGQAAESSAPAEAVESTQAEPSGETSKEETPAAAVSSEAADEETISLPEVQTTPAAAEQRTIYGDYVGPVYKVWWPDHEYPIWIDRYGNELTWEQVPEEVEDVLTGEVRYYCCSHYAADADGRQQWTSCVLYDPDGNVVLEETPYLYYQCLGDLLIRVSIAAWENTDLERDSEHGYDLFDLKTGEVKHRDIAHMKKLDDHQAIALDKDFYLLGILDGNGSVLGGFPTEEKFYSPQPVGGYMTANLVKPGYWSTVVLNAEPRCILHADGWEEEFHLYDCGSRGVYCGLQDSKGDIITTLYKADPWEKLRVLDPGIVRTDGRLIVGSTLEQDKEGYYQHGLYDMEGTLISGPFRDIHVLERDPDGTFRRFLACTKDKMMILDADGTILKERTVPDLNDVYLIPENADYLGKEVLGISVYTWRMDEKEDQAESKQFVLDTDLEDFAPAGYTYVEKAAENVFWGYPEKTGDGSRKGAIVLFSADGTVLMTDLLCVGEGGPDGIPVLTKDRIGLVDEYGRWIGWNDWTDPGHIGA